MLPRDETEDVLSGAVVPPGSSFGPPTPTLERQQFHLPASSSSGNLLDTTGHTLSNDEGNASLPDESLLLATHDHEPPADGETSLSDALLVSPGGTDGYPPEPLPLDSTEQIAKGEQDGEAEEDRQDLDLDQAEYLDDQWLQWELEEEQRLIMQGGAGIPRDDHGNLVPLLDEMHPLDQGRKCLVLDLDETLVHSSFKMIPNADFVVPVEIEDVVHNVYVIKRPGVDEFMRRMGELFEIVVFTASLSKVRQ